MGKLFFFGLLVISSVAQGNELSITEYVKRYIDQDEDYKQARETLNIAEQGLRIAKDLYQTQVTVDPTQQESQFDIQGVDSSTTASTFNFGVTQGLAKGFGLSYDYATRLDDTSDSSTSTIDNSHTFGLSKSLRKNFWGGLERLKIKAAKKELQSTEAAYQLEKWEACQRGVALFVEAYKSQQELALYKEIQKGSSQVLKSTSRSYKRRVVRKIDWLSAQADHLRAESLVNEAQKAWAQDHASLFYFGHELNKKNSPKATRDTQLQNPEGVFDALPIPSDFQLGQNLAYKTALANEKSTRYDMRVAREGEKSEVDLSLSVGQRDGLSSTLAPFEEQFVSLGLTLEWPLHNPSLNASLKSSISSHKIAQSQLNQARRELLESESHLEEELKATRSQLDISGRKLDIYKVQIREARRLLKSGKIEFEDYIRFRDFYLNERLTELSLQQKLWLAQQSQGILYNESQNICLGVQ